MIRTLVLLWLQMILAVGVQGELVQLVVVARHGIRSPGSGPTNPLNEEELSYKDFTSYAMPSFDDQTEKHPYGESLLTEHGRKALRKFGAYFGRYEYPVNTGLQGELWFENNTSTTALQHSHKDKKMKKLCKKLNKEIMVYSDAVERCTESAREFFTGYLPDKCTLQEDSVIVDPKGAVVSDDSASTLFKHKPWEGGEQGEDLESCSGNTESGLRGSLFDLSQTDLTNLFQPQMELIDLSLDQINPKLCKMKNCTLFDIVPGKDELDVSKSIPVVGSMGIASWFSNLILTQWSNNMTYANGIYGDDNYQIIRSIGDIWIYINQSWISLWNTKDFGSEFMAHVLATLSQKVIDTDIKAGLKHNKHKKLIYYSAHHENLVFLGRLLRFQWLSREWTSNPSFSVFGGVLLFELHKGKHHKYYVKVYYEAQDPYQLRYLSDLDSQNAPSRVRVAIPQCPSSEDGCPFEKFREVAMKEIRPECIYSKHLRKWVESQQTTTCITPSIRPLKSERIV